MATATVFNVFTPPGRKADHDPVQLRREAERTMQEVAPLGSIVYFTDGSVDPNTKATGAAFVVGQETVLQRTSDGCSTLQTELEAI